MKVPQGECMIDNIYKHISDIHLYDGETKRMKCPNCGERTFTVTNSKGTLLWNCYRLSCSVSGQKRVRLSVDDIKQRNSRSVEIDTEFVLPNYIIPHRNKRAVLQFCYKYELEPDDIGVMYDVKEDRVVFVVKHNDEIVDATGRSLKNKLPNGNVMEKAPCLTPLVVVRSQ